VASKILRLWTCSYGITSRKKYATQPTTIADMKLRIETFIN